MRKRNAVIFSCWEMPRGRFWKEGIKRRFAFGGYKNKGGLRFSGGRGHRSLHRDASCRGNPAGWQGRIAFRRAENGTGEYFSASIKEEVEHTIKTALSEGVDFLGILPRAERALPQLAKACTREQLWERMAFRVVPKVQITDMGRKR